MNKPVYIELSILKISKTLMYELWCEYIKPKYQNNTKSCNTDMDSLIIKLTLNISIKILLMMLKKDLIFRVMKLIDHYQ